MFTQSQLDEGTEETFRQFFSVQLEGFFEDQFNKLTNNFFIDCVCRHCGQYIKYVSLRALLIHAIGCSKFKLQMETTKTISLEQVEVIEIPFMQCGTSINSQEKTILNTLAEIKSMLGDYDEESDLEEQFENIYSQDHIDQQNTQSEVKNSQSMPIELFNFDKFRKQIIKVTGFSQENASRFLTYIHEGKSARAQTYDNAIENNQHLKDLVSNHWLALGISDPRSTQKNTQQSTRQEIKKIGLVMHRPDLFGAIRFLEMKDLRLWWLRKFLHILDRHIFQNYLTIQTYSKNRQTIQKPNKQNKPAQHKHFNIYKRVELTIYTQILVLFFTGADLCDMPLLTLEMLQKNLYYYTTQKTKRVRNFSLHPDDHQKLQELFNRLKTKKLITNNSNLALGDNPVIIKNKFYNQIKSGPNPNITLKSIKACRACEIFNFDGKECVSSDQIKDFFGHNSLCTTIKYLAEYSKIYHAYSQPFNCPTIGRYINKTQQK